MTMTPQRKRKQGGFTLLELLVGSFVTVMILAGVAAAFAAVQASYQAEAQIRSAVEGSRVSTQYLENLLQYAGYGVDPRYAFDFGPTGLPSGTKDNYSPAGNAFTTDDLAFRYRDPTYLRRGSLTLTTLTLDAATPTFGAALTSGQPLVVACKGAVSYIVLKTRAAATASATSVAIKQYDTPFPIYTTLDACYGRTGTEAPQVMLMYDVRIRVVDLSGRPFLTVFHNFTSPDPTSNTDYDPLAANVENFQVAYVMNRPRPSSACCAAQAAPDAAGNSNWIMGDAGDPVGTLPVFSATNPLYDMDYDNTLRFGNLQGNIRAVRMSVVLRSTRKEPNNRTRAFMPIAAVENFSVTPVADGFYRTMVNTSVRAPNMTSRTFFTPPLLQSGTLATANIWGG